MGSELQDQVEVLGHHQELLHLFQEGGGGGGLHQPPPSPGGAAAPPAPPSFVNPFHTARSHRARSCQPGSLRSAFI